MMTRMAIERALVVLLVCMPPSMASTVVVDFTKSEGTTTTIPTFQNSVNPLYRMDDGEDKPNPIGERVFELEAALGASYVRHAPWFPYPRMSVGEIARGQWDFKYINPVMEAFMKAQNGRPVVMDIEVIPQWMWQTDKPVDVPEDVNIRQVGYEQGTELAVPVERVVEYFDDMYHYYTMGGFMDENGTFHKSNYHYKFDWVEILNEPDYEHGLSPQNYTKIYDAIVSKLRVTLPGTKFLGMSLASHNNFDYYTTFLNRSNHDPQDIPLDGISYHLYVDGGKEQDQSKLQGMFMQRVDEFVEEVEKIESIRKSLSPDTKTFINEIGCAYGGPYTPAYWLACSGMYAYVFGRLAPMGIEVLGSSQMIGFENIRNPTTGKKMEDEWPSTSMVHWEDGSPTSRYWTLKMLIDTLGEGVKRIVPSTIVASSDGDMFAQAFVTEQDKMGKVLLINKAMEVVNVTVSTSATAPGSGLLSRVDMTTDSTRYVTEKVDLNSFSLNPMAIAVLAVDLA